MKTQILTPSVQKGGIGKTTTAAALAQAAAYRGMKTLAIDLDPQGNLSFALAAKPGTGSYEFIQGAPAAAVTQHTAQGIDVMPASINLATLTSERGSARRLQKALEPIKGQYEIIVIDAPTMPGELLFNALQASTGLIIPTEADVYNIQSVFQTVDAARQIQKSNPELKILGVVFTKFSARANLTKQLKQAMIENAREMGLPYLGTIRNAIAVQEAASFQRSLFEYAPKSNPAKDYMALFCAVTNI